jgi:ketosteroid isomerase-like protein
MTTTSTSSAARIGDRDTAARTVRELYAALDEGDVGRLDELMDDHIEVHVPGTGQNAGSYRGKSEVFGFFAAAMELTAGTLRMTLHDVAVGEHHVVAVAEYTATRPGRAPLVNHLAEVFRLRGGRISEVWFHSRNQYEVDAFWS